MRYGYFDDVSREYVITTPETPSPWINYSGNQEFFSLISNTAGGYCFYKDARLRRITRYRYNNVPADTGGRYFYIREESVVGHPPGTREEKAVTGTSGQASVYPHIWRERQPWCRGIDFRAPGPQR